MKLLFVGDFQGEFPEKLSKKIEKEEFDAIIGIGDYAGIKDFRSYVMYALASSKQGIPIISAKDFFGKKKFKKLLKKDRKKAKRILNKLNEYKKPIISVFGNGDDDWYAYKFEKGMKAKKSLRNFLKKLNNFHDITYSKKKFQEIEFIGFGGYMDIDAYFDKKEFKDEQDIMKVRIKRREKSRHNLFSRLKKSKNKNLVFVLHYPPKGVFDIIKDKKDNPMNGKSAGIGFFTDAIRKYKPLIAFCGHMHEYQGMKRIGKTFVINPGDAEKGKYAVIEISIKTRKVRARFER